MTTIKTIITYEASDGKRFSEPDKVKAEIYQEHLNDMKAVEQSYRDKLRKIEEEESRKFYGGR